MITSSTVLRDGQFEWFEAVVVAAVVVVTGVVLALSLAASVDFVVDEAAELVGAEADRGQDRDHEDEVENAAHPPTVRQPPAGSGSPIRRRRDPLWR